MNNIHWGNSLPFYKNDNEQALTKVEKIKGLSPFFKHMSISKAKDNLNV